MMLRLLAVLSAVGVALAGNFKCCTIEDRAELQHYWHGLWSAEFTGRRLQLAQSVFEDFFERDEDAKQAFTRVNVDNMDSPEFKAHVIRVVNGVDTVVGIIDDSPVLKLHLEHLGEQHKVRDHVRPEHFDMMARAFEKVLPQVSGCYNKAAWDHCFSGVTAFIANALSG